MCLVASTCAYSFRSPFFEIVQVREASDAEVVERGMQNPRLGRYVVGSVGWWLSDLIAAATVACKSWIVSIKITDRCFLNTVIPLAFCVRITGSL